MKLRTLSSTMVATLLLIPAPAMLAMPFHRTENVTVRSEKVSMVKFHVRNATGETVALQAGEQTFAVKPGESQELKLPLGQDVTAANNTPHFQAGLTVVHVTQLLQGNTLVLN